MSTEEKKDLPLDQKLLWSVQDFCKAASISRSYFYARLRKGGDLPPVIFIGKRRLIRAEDARAWVEQQTVFNS